MIIDAHVKTIETIFKLAPLINEAVIDERAAREAKHHGKDPTGEMAVAKAMPVLKVRVSSDDKVFVIEKPEDLKELCQKYDGRLCIRRRRRGRI